MNVFIVGATYLKLVKELCLQGIPLIDPSLYISRFAALLEFGDETEKVAYDATRLVRRFNHDWITTGRRPSGVAGACLLIAARMNNFKRSVLEIVQVVKIADVTIKKRLEEFKRSAAGKMTVEDFRTKWLDEAENPPAFEKDKLKKKKKKRKSNKKNRRAGKRLKTEDGQEVDEEDSDEEEEDSDGSEEDESSAAASSRAPSVFSPPPPTALSSVGPSAPPTLTAGVKAKANADDEGSEGSVIEERTFDIDAEETDRWYENQVEDAITQEVEAHLISGTGSRLQNELDAKDRFKQPELIDELDDLDEEELDCFILDEGEVQMKTRVWMELNHEYLEKLAEKKEREANGELKPSKKYASVSSASQQAYRMRTFETAR